MKKVALITFHSSHNYGAILQAFALQRTFINLNTDCKIINYRTNKMVADYKVFKKGKSPKIIIKNCLNLLKARAFNNKYNRFESFINDNLFLTKRYSSLIELMLNPPSADIFVTGSDQVWNGNGVLKDAYFLPFAPENSKKISYSASFGDVMPKEIYTERIKLYLNDFDKISVREQSAKEYVENKLNLSAIQMPDPVFLLEKIEWTKFTNKSKEKKPYIFCYCLSKESKIQEVLSAVKKKTGLKTITVADALKPNVKANKVYYDAGPKEFLTLMLNADFIVTDSFHGTAFSLLMEKQFLSVARKNRSKRIESLLKQFALEDRFVKNANEIVWDKINYKEKNEVKNLLRSNAISFIKKCIE